VVNQRYDPEVQSPSGFLGNNVLVRCNVPSFVRDHVTVTSWLQEPAFNIYPSTMGGKRTSQKYIYIYIYTYTHTYAQREIYICIRVHVYCTLPRALRCVPGDAS